MSTPFDTRPLVDDADVISALIPDSPAALLAPDKTPTEAPQVQYVYVPAPITTTFPAPPMYDEPEKFWDTDWFMVALIALKCATILGIVGILSVYVIYPVVTLVTTIVTVFGEMAVGLATLAIVMTLAYWATSLLGFWDHSRSLARGGESFGTRRLVLH